MAGFRTDFWGSGFATARSGCLFPFADKRTEVGKRGNGVDVYPFPDWPFCLVVRPFALPGREQFLFGQRFQPCADSGNLPAQFGLRLVQREAAVLPVKLPIEPAQIVPFAAFGGGVDGFARLLVPLPLQQQAGPTKLVGQMLKFLQIQTIFILLLMNSI